MDSDSSINDYLSHLLAQANKRLNKQLSEKGVPLDQWRILRVMYENDGMTMRELADAVSLNRPTMSKAIDKLVAEAHVYRVPDPNDRRKIRIFLSDKGKSLFVAQNEHVDIHEDLVKNEFGAEETKQLKSMLETFIKQMS